MEEPKPETNVASAVPPLPQGAGDVAPQDTALPNAAMSADSSSTLPIEASDPPAPSVEPIPNKPKISIKKPDIKVKDPLHVILIVLLIIVAFIALTSYWQSNSLNKTKKDLNQKVTAVQKQVNDLQAPTKYAAQQLKTGQIQAVFLVGGQVYFGNIIHIDDQTMTLQNIFYLRTGTAQKGGTVSGDASLVKLGSELHGPEDKMVIERKNVTFWENLKADSKVSQAIVQYKAAH
jgi:hypothetical protein